MNETVASVKKAQHKKLNYINVFRALAILFIVGGHSIHSRHPLLKPVCSVLLQDGTVLFVFISGFLFQYLSENFEYKSYLKKKFFNVICPYLFTSIPGLLLFLCYSKAGPFAGINKGIQIFMFLTTGWFHNLATWYIFMACIFFLCGPILLAAENKKILKGKSLLFCILIFLIFIPLCIPRVTLPVDVGNAWQKYFSAVEMNVFFTGLFFPVYIWGMFIAAHRKEIFKLYYIRKYLWVAFLMTSFVEFVGLYKGILPGRLLAPKMVLTLLLLGYLEHYDDKLISMKRINNWLDLIASLSFAIFFIHGYVLVVENFILRHFSHLPTDIFVFNGSNLLIWLGINMGRFVGAFLGSLILAILVKKILLVCGIKHTRWFIGA